MRFITPNVYTKGWSNSASNLWSYSGVNVRPFVLTFQGYLKVTKMGLFESSHVISYSCSIETISISSSVFELLNIDT